MDEDLIGEARRRVRQAYGRNLEEKASDAYCLAFDPRPDRVSAIRPVVVEMEAVPLREIPYQMAVETLRAALPDEMMDPARSAIRELFGESFVPFSESHLNVTALVREVYVSDLQERSEAADRPILEQLRRGTSARFSIVAEWFQRAGRDLSDLQYCWLNQSVRTWADPFLLAEVAGDPRVERLDLPRKLFLEMDVSVAAINAAVFRGCMQSTGKDVVVAVIDSKVKADHPALLGRVHLMRDHPQKPGPDAHGTAVAGIIASNDARFTGIAPGATIYNYVVASTLGGDADDIDGGCAIAQALKDKVRIANCSWGTCASTDGTSRETRACDRAWLNGMTVVKSAGNEGPDPNTITAPGDAEHIIVVGATGKRGIGVPTYSGRGPSNGRPRPHLVAPGGIQGGKREIQTASTDDGFNNPEFGTSYAAAHVSGALAVLLQARPHLTPDEQLSWLTMHCKPLKHIPNEEGAGFLVLPGC